MASGVLTAALTKVAKSGILRTKLSAEELAEIRTSIRRRAIFSAKVSNGRILEAIRKTTEAVLKKEISPLTARGILQSTVDRSRYKATAGKEGTIEDLASDARIDLIVRTNVDMARGYGTLVDGQKNLEDFPFWELFRRQRRLEPRDWPVRWRQGGRTLRRGKMVAPVNDAIWKKLSAFDTPYPPFDYNSGMWVRRMNARRGNDLGLRIPIEQKPKRLPKWDDEQAAIPKDPKMAEQLLKDLGPGYEISRGVVKRR